MNIEVTGTTVLKQIQEDFSKIYPFLKVEFLYGAHNEYGESITGKPAPNTMLNNFLNFNGTRIINIDGTNTVAEIESAFWITLKLKIKIMRKSGNVWVGTSYTGNWTLDNQNYEGGQIVIDFV